MSISLKALAEAYFEFQSIASMSGTYFKNLDPKSAEATGASVIQDRAKIAQDLMANQVMIILKYGDEDDRERESQ